MKNIAMFTDIHWGKKNNSPVHNQDCTDFIDWFIHQVKLGDYDTIIFLGDWFENRNAINVSTLVTSMDAMRKLNELGLPIYFIVGNHDLYHRENRSVFSTQVHGEFANVVLVDEPLVVEDALIVPYLFEEEYPSLLQYSSIPYWFGHFGFRNFVVTGSDRRMEHGPGHEQFSRAKRIFSGHFHKRQANDNIVYIGNTFPMDYGDAWDDARGMATLNIETGEVDFIDWVDCPKYRRIRMSEVLQDAEMTFPSKCRVRCLMDVPLSYSDAQELKNALTSTYELREFVLEEDGSALKAALEGADIESFENQSIDDTVIQLLQTGLSTTKSIKSDQLVRIYESL
jgi:DNA repair exonuclease SbcCD nuclease subunit